MSTADACCGVLSSGVLIFFVFVAFKIVEAYNARKQQSSRREIMRKMARNCVKHIKENVHSHKTRRVADTTLAMVDTLVSSSEFGFMMNVGPEKGVILDNAFRECKPTTALELGAYCGYSAVRMGRLLHAGHGRLVSLEVDPEYVNLSTEFVKMSGLEDRVEVKMKHFSFYLGEHF